MTVIQIVDPDDGAIRAYRTLSERLPAFLEQYPPAQGYSVQIRVVDALSTKPALLRLYEVALAHGHAPEAVGLPGIDGARTLLFEAMLRDPEDRVLLTASALTPIASYKDYECGETAARQRLVAAAGFAGEVLEADELADATHQGLAPAIGPVSGAAVTGTEPDAPEAAVPVAMLRQIEHLAKLRNETVDVTQIGDRAQAVAEIRRLSAAASVAA